MKNETTFDPQRLLKMLCFLVLAFIPINMLASPVVDFLIIENREANWTVTLSAYSFVSTSMLFFAGALFFLKSRREKLFLRAMLVFFGYAFAFTMSEASDPSYPIYGLISVLGAVLVATLFYVAVRDNIVTPKIVVYTLAFASVFVIMPLLLVHIDIERFVFLSKDVGASTILYGYENPRAVGWVSTISLSLLAAFLSTQPKEDRIRPIFLLLVMIVAVTLFWSGSRGGVVAFAVSISLVFALSRTKNYKGLLYVFSCIAAGGGVSYFLHLPNQAYGMFARISQNLAQENIADVSSGRTELWQTTVAYILERPFSGYGYLPHKNLEGLSHGSAHNIVLEAWFGFGLIIGTLVVLGGLLLWVMTLKSFREANNQYISALFCVVTTLLIYSMISGPYARTFPLLLFAVPAGAILGLRSASANQQ